MADSTLVKKEFHRLIDSIEDDTVLETFLQLLTSYQELKEGKDIIDELNEQQKARLFESLKQIEAGDTIDHETVMKGIRQLITTN